MSGNEIEIVVGGKNDSRPALAEARADSKATAASIEGDLKGIGDESTKTGAKVKDSTTGMGKAQSDFDRLLKGQLNDEESAYQSLQRVIGQTKSDIVGMQQELQRAPSNSNSGALFGDLQKAEADLKKLEGLMDDMGGKSKASGKKSGDNFIEGLVSSIPFIGGFISSVSKKLASLLPEAAKIGEEAGTDLAEGMTSAAGAAAEDLPQLFTPQGVIGLAIVGAIVGGLAAVIGGAIGTALALGVGLGFIGIGAYLDRGNAQVEGAFQRLKTSLITTMTAAAAPLVKPFADAEDTIGKLFVKLEPAFHGIFSALAPVIPILTNGLTGFISMIVPKLEDVAHVFTNMFADQGVQNDLHLLETAIAIMFNELSANDGHDVIAFFKLLINVITFTMATVDAFIYAWHLLVLLWDASPFAKAISDFISIMNALGLHTKATQADTGAVTANYAAIVTLGGAIATSTPDWQALTDKMGQATATADSFAQAVVDKVLGALMNSDEATLHWHESLTTLNDTLKKNKDSLDINSVAGQANREAILGAVEANIKLYDTNIASGLSASDAAKAYDKNFNSLEHLPGLTSKQQRSVDALVKSYKTVPDKVNTDLSITGLTNAIEDLNTAINNLLFVDGFVATAHVTFKLTNAGQLNSEYDRLQKLGAYRATGGVVGGAATGAIKQGLTWVGEHGAELVSLPAGSMVHSNPDSMRMATDSAGASAGVTAAQLSFAGGLDSALATLVQKMFRNGQIQLRVGNQLVTV